MKMSLKLLFKQHAYPLIFSIGILTATSLTELLLMLSIDKLPLTTVSKALLSGILLSVPLLMLIYFFMYKPLMQNISLLEKTNKELCRDEREIFELSDFNRRLFEIAFVGIWIVDLLPLTDEDGGTDPCHFWHKQVGTKIAIGDVNTKLCEMLGVKKDEIISRSIFDPAFIDGENAKIFVRAILARREGERGSYEIALKHKDGHAVPVLINVVPVRFDKETGKVTESMGVMTDLSAMKRANEAQRLSEEKFSKVFLSSPDSIVMTRLRDGMFIEVNDRFLNLLGYTRDKIIGKTVTELNVWTNPDDRKVFAGILRDKGVINSFETTFRAKDGKIIPCLISGQTIEIEGETYIISTAADISRLKKAEEGIRFFASIVQNLHDAVCSIDTKGNIFSWNKGAEEMLGYKAEEIIGRHITAIIPQEVAPKELDQCTNILNHEGFFSGYQAERITKDGRVVPVEISAVALKDKEQRIEAYTFIMIDITSSWSNFFPLPRPIFCRTNTDKKNQTKPDVFYRYFSCLIKRGDSSRQSKKGIDFRGHMK
jgi:PAS domain S-box-containing protein